MKIGQLRHRITLNKVEYVQDDIGNEIEQEVVIGTVWAKVSNLFGKEFFAAASTKLEKTVSFLIRYMPKVDESVVIEFNGKSYGISFVDNIKYGNEYLEMKAILITRK